MTTARSNSIPRISVITVTFRAAATLRHTIESVIHQSADDFEFLVVDGGSDDGTLDILREYGSQINWVSEKDNGIYDAMNKGVSRATGDYIIFLGADDSLIDNNVLKKAADDILHQNRPDIWCGRVSMTTNAGNLSKIIGNPLSDQNVLSGQIPPHQGMLSTRELLLEHPFDTRYRICADRDFFVWAWSVNKRVEFSDLCVADYGTAGTSASSFKAARESAEIVRKYFPEQADPLIKIKSYAKIFILSQLQRLGILGFIRRKMGRWN